MASSETADVACRQTPGDVAVGADQHRVGLAEAVVPLDLAIGVDEVLPDDEHLHRDVWQVHDGVVPAVAARTGEQGQPAFEQVDGRAPVTGVGDPGVWGPGSRARRRSRRRPPSRAPGRPAGWCPTRTPPRSRGSGRGCAPGENASSEARALWRPTGYRSSA